MNLSPLVKVSFFLPILLLEYVALWPLVHQADGCDDLAKVLFLQTSFFSGNKNAHILLYNTVKI